MNVQVISAKCEAYHYLEEIYAESTRFLYCSGWEEAELSMEESDIILADPSLADQSACSSVRVRNHLAEGGAFLVCAPEKKKSLIRELKAAGLEADQKREYGNPVRKVQNSAEQRAEAGERKRPEFRHVIGVIELTREADAGLITMMLAEEMASDAQRDGSLVTVFAPECSCFYYALGLGERMGDKGFCEVNEWEEQFRIQESEEPESIPDIPNLLEGISWMTASGQSRGQEERMDETSGIREKRIGKVQGNYILCCFSSETFQEEMQTAADYLEAVLVVTDARPTSLMAGRSCLNRIRESNLPAVYAVSHVNRSVRRDLILDFLEAEKIVFLPDADPVLRCEAEYAQENPYRVEGIRNAMMNSVSRIIEHLKSCFTEEETPLL